MSDSEMRLECLNIASRLGLPEESSVLAAAETFYAFVANAQAPAAPAKG